MALDQSFVGRTYPPTAAYEVGREKIREFAEAIGDPNPAYTDPDAAKALGHPDVIAPPTFAFAITFKAAGQVIQRPRTRSGLQPGGSANASSFLTSISISSISTFRREARRNQRPDHHRFRQRHAAVRRRRQMRHHHAR